MRCFEKRRISKTEETINKKQHPRIPRCSVIARIASCRFPVSVLGFSSICMINNKRIQTLASSYMVHTQNIRCIVCTGVMLVFFVDSDVFEQTIREV